jgi:hypothetical protein
MIVEPLQAPAASGLAWTDANTVMGYRAEVSTNVPSNLTRGSGSGLSAAVLGNWDDMFFGLWGEPSILVDPTTQSRAGVIRITCLCDFGVDLRHAASFAVVPDMVTT